MSDMITPTELEFEGDADLNKNFRGYFNIELEPDGSISVVVAEHREFGSDLRVAYQCFDGERATEFITALQAWIEQLPTNVSSS